MSNFRNPELIHTFKSTSKTASWKEETQKFSSSDAELSYATLAAHHCPGIFCSHIILLIHTEFKVKSFIMNC